ncbi:MAG: hypothetical protein AAB495_01660, partial [Patescibacteria group bacterium]
PRAISICDYDEMRGAICTSKQSRKIAVSIFSSARECRSINKKAARQSGYRTRENRGFSRRAIGFFREATFVGVILLSP